MSVPVMHVAHILRHAVCYVTGMVTCSQWLVDCCHKVASLGVFGDHVPNHVLVNEYIPGQGIMVRSYAIYTPVLLCMC